MRKGGGKSKGAAFERAICKELSLWLSRGKREDLLWRSAMSGGRSTVAARKGLTLKSQAGDISSIDKLSHSFIDTFYIECKFYRDLQLGSLIKGSGKLFSFWDIAKKEARLYKKLPILIAKQNNHPIIVCLSADSLRKFEIFHRKCRVIIPQKGLFVIYYNNFLKLEPKWKR